MSSISFSADATLRICERRWLLGAVIAHPTAKDTFRREAHLLRQLTHSVAWAGKIVHSILERSVIPAVRGGEVPSTSYLIDRACELLRKQADFSRQKLYRTVSKATAPDDFCALFADEYGKGLAETDRKDAEDRVILALSNAVGLDQLWSDVHHATRIFPESPFRVTLEGAVLEAKPDLVLLSGHRITVIDWKCWTSLTADPSDQLRFYAYVLGRYWQNRNIRPEDFRLLAVNLFTPSVVEVACEPGHLDDADDRITEFLERSRDVLDGRGWEDIPLRSLKGPRNPETCQRCKFRGICRDAAPATKEGTQWLFPYYSMPFKSRSLTT